MEFSFLQLLYVKFIGRISNDSNNILIFFQFFKNYQNNKIIIILKNNIFELLNFIVF